MYLPKSDVYNSLKELNYYVSQTQPPVFEDLPAIIFKVGNNSLNYDLDNNILSQDLDIQIDIWAEDSVTASNVLSQVEKTMRSNLYEMSFSNDVPNIGNLFHIVSRFTKSI
ncbi:hypothetical protein IJE86_01300 [bacterium]|nr:hypothetical protein [bacterium]